MCAPLTVLVLVSRCSCSLFFHLLLLEASLGDWEEERALEAILLAMLTYWRVAVGQDVASVKRIRASARSGRPQRVWNRYNMAAKVIDRWETRAAGRIQHQPDLATPAAVACALSFGALLRVDDSSRGTLSGRGTRDVTAGIYWITLIRCSGAHRMIGGLPFTLSARSGRGWRDRRRHGGTARAAFGMAGLWAVVYVHHTRGWVRRV